LQALSPRMLAPGCHSNCLTCSEPGIKNCLTCPSGRELSTEGSCEPAQLQPPTTPLTEPMQPAAFDPNGQASDSPTSQPLPGSGEQASESLACPAAYMPVRDHTCISCFPHSDFLAHPNDCTTGELHRYCDWTAEVSWASDSQTSIIVGFRFMDVERVAFFPVAPAALRVASTVLTERHALSANGSVSGVSSRVGDVVQLRMSMQAIQAGSDVLVEIENVSEVKKNVVWENATHSLVLVQKKVSAVLQGLHSRKSLDPATTSVGKDVKSVGRVSAVAYSATSIGGSVCSFNFSIGLVKLFQIIEILGKFYFLPVRFSPLTDYFLELIFGVSDIITTEPSLVIGSQREAARWNGKLSSSGQEKHLLRSMPLMVLLYLAVLLIDACAQFFLHSSSSSERRKKAVKKVTASVRWIALQMNLVDLVFYSVYALTGSWFPLTPMQCLNKLAASLIMFESVSFLYSIVFLATTGKKYSRNPCHQAILSSIVFEGVKRKAPTAAARNINSFFVYRLIYFQLVVVCLQNSPGSSVLLLCGTQLVFLTHFLFVWATCNPFETFVAFLEKLSFEVCISFFLMNVCITYFKKSKPIFDIFVICMVLVCILMQVVSIFCSLYKYIRKNLLTSKQAKVTRAKSTMRRTYLSSIQPPIPSNKITKVHPTLAAKLKTKSITELAGNGSIDKPKLHLPANKRSQITANSSQTKLMVRKHTFAAQIRKTFIPSTTEFPANQKFTNRRTRMVAHKTAIDTSNESNNDLPVTSQRNSRIQEASRKLT